ncbi:MAG: BolA family transcriptional regulator [Proteobacteria bacterium]|nr:BolA family transcriptional regulator [Pseudomonadota bacterium]
MKAEDIIQRIQLSLPSAEISAYDMTGGGDHWRLTIRAREFQGLTLVEQHQLIYKALGEWMAGPIHALSLVTQVLEL